MDEDEKALREDVNRFKEEKAFLLEEINRLSVCKDCVGRCCNNWNGLACSGCSGTGDESDRVVNLQVHLNATIERGRQDIADLQQQLRNASSECMKLEEDFQSLKLRNDGLLNCKLCLGMGYDGDGFESYDCPSQCLVCEGTGKEQTRIQLLETRLDKLEHQKRTSWADEDDYADQGTSGKSASLRPSTTILSEHRRGAAGAVFEERPGVVQLLSTGYLRRALEDYCGGPGPLVDNMVDKILDQPKEGEEEFMLSHFDYSWDEHEEVVDDGEDVEGRSILRTLDDKMGNISVDRWVEGLSIRTGKENKSIFPEAINKVEPEQTWAAIKNILGSKELEKHIFPLKVVVQTKWSRQVTLTGRRCITRKFYAYGTLDRADPDLNPVAKDAHIDARNVEGALPAKDAKFIKLPEQWEFVPLDRDEPEMVDIMEEVMKHSWSTTMIITGDDNRGWMAWTKDSSGKPVAKDRDFSLVISEPELDKKTAEPTKELAYKPASGCGRILVRQAIHQWNREAQLKFYDEVLKMLVDNLRPGDEFGAQLEKWRLQGREKLSPFCLAGLAYSKLKESKPSVKKHLSKQRRDSERDKDLREKKRQLQAQLREALRLGETARAEGLQKAMDDMDHDGRPFDEGASVFEIPVKKLKVTKETKGIQFLLGRKLYSLSDDRANDGRRFAVDEDSIDADTCFVAHRPQNCQGIVGSHSQEKRTSGAPNLFAPRGWLINKDDEVYYGKRFEISPDTTWDKHRASNVTRVEECELCQGHGLLPVSVEKCEGCRGSGKRQITFVAKRCSETQRLVSVLRKEPCSFTKGLLSSEQEETPGHRDTIVCRTGLEKLFSDENKDVVWEWVVMVCYEFSAKAHLDNCVLGGRDDRSDDSQGYLDLEKCFGDVAIVGIFPEKKDPAYLSSVEQQQQLQRCNVVFPNKADAIRTGDRLLLPRNFVTGDNMLVSNDRRRPDKELSFGLPTKGFGDICGGMLEAVYRLNDKAAFTVSGGQSSADTQRRSPPQKSANNHRPLPKVSSGRKGVASQRQRSQELLHRADEAIFDQTLRIFNQYSMGGFPGWQLPHPQVQLGSYCPEFPSQVPACMFWQPEDEIQNWQSWQGPASSHQDCPAPFSSGPIHPWSASARPIRKANKQIKRDDPVKIMPGPRGLRLDKTITGSQDGDCNELDDGHSLAHQ